MAFRQVNTLKSRYFTFTEADMHVLGMRDVLY